MSEAPERIWAYHATDIEVENPGCTIIAGESQMDFSQEYIRADLVPAPSVTVKPLDWGDYDYAAVEIPEGYSVYDHGDGEWSVHLTWRTGSEKLNDAEFPSIGAAKAAAQADYESRILAAVQTDPAPGWQPIETAPVGIPVLSYCYGGEVLMTRINKNREDEYARNPDLWMPIPKPPTKESTHD